MPSDDNCPTPIEFDKDGRSAFRDRDGDPYRVHIAGTSGCVYVYLTDESDDESAYPVLTGEQAVAVYRQLAEAIQEHDRLRPKTVEETAIEALDRAPCYSGEDILQALSDAGLRVVPANDADA